MAVPVLAGTGTSMYQHTPPATQLFPKRKMLVGKRHASAASTSSASSRKSGNGTEGEEDDDNYQVSCCGRVKRKRARDTSESGGSDAERQKRPRTLTVPLIELPAEVSNEWESDILWAKMAAREDISLYKTMPNYPDIRDPGTIPPGARRRSVNVMLLMAKSLNLELCTPNMSISIFDRFLSHVHVLQKDPNCMPLISMVCMNLAGKVADIDRGYCGSKGVLDMIRDATHPSFKCKTFDQFAISVASLERIILCTLDSTLFSVPIAMQCISEATDWDEKDEISWLYSALICDIFSTDSVSTVFPQHQIARGVISLVSKKRIDIPIIEPIKNSLRVFIGSSSEKDVWRDPYYGARQRHANNPALALLKRDYDIMV